MIESSIVKSVVSLIVKPGILATASRVITFSVFKTSDGNTFITADGDTFNVRN